MSGETRVTSQHSASPSCVAPYATKSRRRRSSGSTPGAGVRTSHCCGTTWPSGPIGFAHDLSTRARVAWLAGRDGRCGGRQHSDHRKHRPRHRSRVHGPHIYLVRRAAAGATAAAKRDSKARLGDPRRTRAQAASRGRSATASASRLVAGRGDARVARASARSAGPAPVRSVGVALGGCGVHHHPARPAARGACGVSARTASTRALGRGRRVVRCKPPGVPGGVGGCLRALGARQRARKRALSKSCYRDLLRKALQNSLWPKLYETEVRSLARSSR